ncbi:MAG: leucyl/phenylalanyl-tRNA--protein transferase [Thermodesulfobacteriota bacterium]|nr:leucyl/phenylalanyl-tRNA--protein transferase [Thermodesulfobacteriota bacterium]
MPVFFLSENKVFPPPELARKDGLLAVGGDLSEERLILAYRMGIFPWFSDDSPILWWSPDPRLVLFPDELHISERLKRIVKKNFFEVSFDKAFKDVIESCAKVHRKRQAGTWIGKEMIDAYCKLHYSGFAHSIECWQEGNLAGGLYGVSLGKVFFGESMFTKISNASKVAFIKLVQKIKEWDFTLIDCQVTTRHLMSFGARDIPRRKFLKILNHALKSPTYCGSWL